MGEQEGNTNTFKRVNQQGVRIADTYTFPHDEFLRRVTYASGAMMAGTPDLIDAAPDSSSGQLRDVVVGAVKGMLPPELVYGNSDGSYASVECSSSPVLPLAKLKVDHPQAERDLLMIGNAKAIIDATYFDGLVKSLLCYPLPKWEGLPQSKDGAHAVLRKEFARAVALSEAFDENTNSLDVRRDIRNIALGQSEKPVAPKYERLISDSIYAMLKELFTTLPEGASRVIVRTHLGERLSFLLKNETTDEEAKKKLNDLVRTGEWMQIFAKSLHDYETKVVSGKLELELDFLEEEPSIPSDMHVRRGKRQFTYGQPVNIWKGVHGVDTFSYAIQVNRLENDRLHVQFFRDKEPLASVSLPMRVNMKRLIAVLGEQNMTDEAIQNKRAVEFHDFAGFVTYTAG